MGLISPAPPYFGSAHGMVAAVSSGAGEFRYCLLTGAAALQVGELGDDVVLIAIAPLMTSNPFPARPRSIRNSLNWPYWPVIYCAPTYIYIYLALSFNAIIACWRDCFRPFKSAKKSLWSNHWKRSIRKAAITNDCEARASMWDLH